MFLKRPIVTDGWSNIFAHKVSEDEIGGYSLYQASIWGSQLI